MTHLGPHDRGESSSLESLDRFYRLHAPVYDWTRPFLLLGRGRLLALLRVGPGERVLDVGCGTGWSFVRLVGAGATVLGVEPCAAMRARAERRAVRWGDAVVIDPTPYDRGPAVTAGVDVVLFSYSLTMMPRFQEAVSSARDDLRTGGRLGVVDFLDAVEPWPAAALRASHVALGPERLEALRRAFPSHAVEIHTVVGLWRYFIFRATG